MPKSHTGPELVLCWTRRAALIFGAAMAVGAAAATAHDYKQGDVQIGHPWAPPAGAGADTTSVYFAIVNRGRMADRLVAATSDIAARVEIVELVAGALRRLDDIALPPNTPVALRPGGRHLRLTGLGRRLAAGDRFPLALRLVGTGAIAVEVLVEERPQH
ncbi:MAG: copper chaperone PCu(A)C [Proteobacteria bacterium]|nr:copper chaperone PCu(A)C [Pseudomonadota bacterium]